MASTMTLSLAHNYGDSFRGEIIVDADGQPGGGQYHGEH